MTEIVQIITAGIASLGFAMLYNVRGKRLVVTILGGILSWSLYLLLNSFIGNMAMQYFFVTVFLTTYTEIAARIVKTPTTTFLVSAIIILMPGGSLFNTMSCAIQGNWNDFFIYGVDTVTISVAIALGIMFVSSVVKIIYTLGKKSLR